MALTVFSDFTCPFSYLTEVAIRRLLVHHEPVEVRYRAMELYPADVAIPAPADEEAWQPAAAELARSLDVRLEIPSFRPRSRKAHEAACFARSRGIEDAMRDAIFHAYWVDQLDIGRIDVLTGLVAALDTDPIDLKIALDLDLHEPEAVADTELAHHLHLPGTPTIYLGSGQEARILVGAQTPAALDEAIRGG